MRNEQQNEVQVEDLSLISRADQIKLQQFYKEFYLQCKLISDISDPLAKAKAFTKATMDMQARIKAM